MLDFQHFPLAPADVLLVVPPFASLDRPSLAVHLLQACAREKGFSVSVLYANLLLAKEIGERNYEVICHAPTSDLLGERFFAKAAHDESISPPAFELSNTRRSSRVQAYYDNLDIDLVRDCEGYARNWAVEVGSFIIPFDFKVVGCSTTFEQTNASIALLKELKRRNAKICTIIGGANCEGTMANGIASVGGAIDYIFSGESESTFVGSLAKLLAECRLDNQVVVGSPLADMNSLPLPSFAEYYEQFNWCLPESALWQSQEIWLPYESSRGCWWGEKHHCTFCGINGQGMSFRACY